MKKLLSFLLIVVCVPFVFSLCSGCAKSEKKVDRYEITARYIPETSTVAGAVKMSYQNRTDTEITALKFNLWGNAYREDAAYSPVSPALSSFAYYDGKSYGGVEITSVGGAKNWEVLGEDANILCVVPEHSLFPGDILTVDIGFTTKLAKVNHRTGVTGHTVNLGNFFPVLCAYQNGFVECPYYSDGDPFLSECANYKVTLTAPKEYVVASTGKLVDERTLESKKEHTMTVTNARDFAMVLSTEYKVESCVVGGVQILYYYYNDDTPAAHLAAVKDCFEYYSSSFGEYPYKTYSVAQTGVCFAGMEYPALTMISDALSKEDYVYTLAHETAHQWWYAAVGSDQICNAWQDEGLAEYSAAAFFNSKPSYGFTEASVIEEATANYRSYYDVYSRVFGQADTRMTRHLKEYLSDYEYRSIAYDKGVILFHTLKTGMGEKRFLSGLRKYYEKYRFQIASPEDMIGCFEKAGVDVGGLFASFLEGKAII